MHSLGAQISVYGYDLSMLQSIETQSKPTSPAPRKPCQKALDLFVKMNSKRCQLLELPNEIRFMILKFALPGTINTHKDVAWIRGSTNLLATNRQLFQEGTEIMYSHNTFLIDIYYDCVVFSYQWILENGLIPMRLFPFPEQVPPILSKRNIALMRRFRVRIHHVDSYMGYIKYQQSGAGLTYGLIDQIRPLVQLLGNLDKILSLQIHLDDGSVDPEAAKAVFEPFKMLTRTHKATVTIFPPPCASANQLQDKLQDAWHKNSFLRLPPEIRKLVYAYAFLQPAARASWRMPSLSTYAQSKSIANKCNPSGKFALSYTCHTIYQESLQVFFSTSPNFELNFIADDRYTFRPIKLSWELSEYTNSLSIDEFPKGLPMTDLPALRTLRVELRSSWGGQLMSMQAYQSQIKMVRMLGAMLHRKKELQNLESLVVCFDFCRIAPDGPEWPDGEMAAILAVEWARRGKTLGVRMHREPELRKRLELLVAEEEKRVGINKNEDRLYSEKVWTQL
jgi:hypothetical protein